MIAPTTAYNNSQELHQTGENLQVARWGRPGNGSVRAA